MAKFNRARLPRFLAVAVGTAVTMLLVSAQVASAAPQVFTIQPGSTLTLNSSPPLVFQVGKSACNDGQDNDLDGNTDGADAQCVVPIAADANERLAGSQAFTPPKITADITGNVLTIDPNNIVFQQGEVCFNALGVRCLGALIDGTGPVQVGTINGATGQISIGVQVTVFLTNIGANTPGFVSPCRIGPVNGTLTSNNYNPAAQTATLTANGLTVPAVTDNCGSFLGVNYRSQINSRLGLPTTANVSFLLAP